MNKVLLNIYLMIIFVTLSSTASRCDTHSDCCSLVTGTHFGICLNGTCDVITLSSTLFGVHTCSLNDPSSCGSNLISLPYASSSCLAKGPPAVVGSSGQCPRCYAFSFTYNATCHENNSYGTCSKINGCCSFDSQCDTCYRCSLMNGTCEHIPGCCLEQKDCEVAEDGSIISTLLKCNLFGPFDFARQPNYPGMCINTTNPPSTCVTVGQSSCIDTHEDTLDSCSHATCCHASLGECADDADCRGWSRCSLDLCIGTGNGTKVCSSMPKKPYCCDKKSDCAIGNVCCGDGVCAPKCTEEYLNPPCYTGSRCGKTCCQGTCVGGRWCCSIDHPCIDKGIVPACATYMDYSGPEYDDGSFVFEKITSPMISPIISPIISPPEWKFVPQPIQGYSSELSMIGVASHNYLPLDNGYSIVRGFNVISSFYFRHVKNGGIIRANWTGCLNIQIDGESVMVGCKLNGSPFSRHVNITTAANFTCSKWNRGSLHNASIQYSDANTAIPILEILFYEDLMPSCGDEGMFCCIDGGCCECDDYHPCTDRQTQSRSDCVAAHGERWCNEAMRNLDICSSGKCVECQTVDDCVAKGYSNDNCYRTYCDTRTHSCKVNPVIGCTCVTDGDCSKNNVSTKCCAGFCRECCSSGDCSSVHCIDTDCSDVGTCEPGQNISNCSSDENPCTLDECIEGLGCSHIPIPGCRWCDQNPSDTFVFNATICTIVSGEEVCCNGDSMCIDHLACCSANTPCSSLGIVTACAIYRDFNSTFEDMVYGQREYGITDNFLGYDHLPTDNTVIPLSPKVFDFWAWFHDSSNSTRHDSPNSIVFEKVANFTWEFIPRRVDGSTGVISPPSGAFFPLDGFGVEEYAGHNFYFTLAFTLIYHMDGCYAPRIGIRSDDDAFVFVDDILLLDNGGRHGVDPDYIWKDLPYVNDTDRHFMDVFYAERGIPNAALYIRLECVDLEAGCADLVNGTCHGTMCSGYSRNLNTSNIRCEQASECDAFKTFPCADIKCIDNECIQSGAAIAGCCDGQGTVCDSGVCCITVNSQTGTCNTCCTNGFGCSVDVPMCIDDACVECMVGSSVGCDHGSWCCGDSKCHDECCSDLNISENGCFSTTPMCIDGHCSECNPQNITFGCGAEEVCCQDARCHEKCCVGTTIGCPQSSTPYCVANTNSMPSCEQCNPDTCEGCASGMTCCAGVCATVCSDGGARNSSGGGGHGGGGGGGRNTTETDCMDEFAQSICIVYGVNTNLYQEVIDSCGLNESMFSYNSTTGCHYSSDLCSDENPCTKDFCKFENMFASCAHIPVQCSPTTVCNKTTGMCGPSASMLCPYCANVCDDGDPCTIDIYDKVHDVCINEPMQCNDSDACTMDGCMNGTCIHSSPMTCPSDGNLCVTKTCDPRDGICKISLLIECIGTDPCAPLECGPNGTCVSIPIDCGPDSIGPCATTSCVDGKCVNHSVPVCELELSQDMGPCDSISCDPTKGCIVSHSNCSDGDPCTFDECRDDECIHIPLDCRSVLRKSLGRPLGPCENVSCSADRNGCYISRKSCDDDDPCTTDRCDERTGTCTSVTKDCGCSETDACTLCGCSLDGDGGGGGGCWQISKSCDDGDEDTEDWCEPDHGCRNRRTRCGRNYEDELIPCHEYDKRCNIVHTTCDDRNPCTSDWCIVTSDSSDMCAHTRRCAWIEGDDRCYVKGSNCDPNSTEICKRPERKSCDDRDECTEDFCKDGRCEHFRRSCDQTGSTMCSWMECSSTVGECIDVERDCDDDDPFTVDGCDDERGCIHIEPRDVAERKTVITCEDDNDPCTIERRRNGICVYEPLCDHVRPSICSISSCMRISTKTAVCIREPKDCSDSDPCTIDYCDERLGCIHTLKTCDDDGDPCTIESCIAGKCVHVPLSCGDGNLKTFDRCANGICVHEELKNCDDGKWCTEDVYDSTTNTCSHIPVTCVNDNKCISVECVEDSHGICVGSPIVCDRPDNDPCIVSNCNLITGNCETSFVDCSDSKNCTIDSCKNVDGAAVCTHEPDDKLCNDGDPLTIDTCSLDVGCLHEKLPVVCTASNSPCETCSYSATADACICESKTCDDGDGCTIDSCDETNGECIHVKSECQQRSCMISIGCMEGSCRYEEKTCGVDERCNYTTGDCENAALRYAVGYCVPIDSKPCEIYSRLEDGGPCVVIGSKNCSDDNACTVDSCDSISGECVHIESCDDGDPCTDDSCVSGDTCSHVQKSCDDGDACTIDMCVGVCIHTRNTKAGTCDPITGIMTQDVPYTNETRCTDGCDDSDDCTVDTCSSGMCDHVTTFCKVSDGCHIGRCVNGFGCIYSEIMCVDPSQSCDLSTSECKNPNLVRHVSSDASRSSFFLMIIFIIIITFVM